MDKSLSQFYAEHAGKVSDKWSSYLNVYERLFREFRHQPINMLEIGVQNGGSLELWLKYFKKAEHLIGCDINTKCANLEYDDPRISVVVGDATEKQTQQLILDECLSFNIIIDDGSHISEDIVKAFSLYFPKIMDGGIFVAEDLHCSYWMEYGGGLAAPFSCITFFKHLADIVNHQHWGVDRERSFLLKGFCERYDISLDEASLATIHSVEFINSICVVRKEAASANLLGSRFIAGQTESVASGHFQLSEEDASCNAPSQKSNPWSLRELPPQEELPEVLNRLMMISDAHQALLESTSWRLTRPLRAFSELVKRLRNKMHKSGDASG